MKVKFNNKEIDNSNLVYGKIYILVAIDFIKIGNLFQVKFRIINEKGTPALYDKCMFEVIDDSIDKDFVYKDSFSGNFELIPKMISYNGFWEEFFDGEDEAVDFFDKRFE